MKNHQSGQILPFCVLLIVILLGLIISNFEIGFLNFRKIQQQKKVDGISMRYATDYARGLNALAALNQALTIASQRGYMMAEVYAGLAACMALVAVCAKAFQNLSAEIVPFYIKLNKLGKDLAKQQEGIISWMLQSRCAATAEMSVVFEDIHLYPVFPCTFDGDYRKLPFYRPDGFFGKFAQDLPITFDIPAPLVFKAVFFQMDHKMILMASNKVDSDFRKMRIISQHDNLPKKVWGLTEVNIEGSDFQKMKFKPKLDSVSLQQPLWRDAIRKKPWVDWPNLISNQHEILH